MLFSCAAVATQAQATLATASAVTRREWPARWASKDGSAGGPVNTEDIRPRLYALGLDDSGGAVRAWQAELSGRLHAARFYEAEKRPFWAHVTLARGKRNRPLPRMEATPLPPALTRPFTPERATLYRSTLTPRGAVYEPLAHIDLPS